MRHSPFSFKVDEVCINSLNPVFLNDIDSGILLRKLKKINKKQINWSFSLRKERAPFSFKEPPYLLKTCFL